MRALLVNPFQVNRVHKKGRIYNRTWTPLDLANCGAVLEEAGVEVNILDANAEQIGPEEVSQRSRRYQKVFITSTNLDRWQCPQLDINPFLRTVKALNDTGAEVYVMGSHGTVKPVEMLADTGAAAIIRGEPERIVLELCKGAPLASVNGITWRRNGEAVNNPDPKPVKLDDLPRPAFHLLPMHRYRDEVLGDHFTLFEMSRGCASHGAFGLLKTYGTGVGKKSVDRLANEIEYVIKNFGVRTAYFMDLEFTVLRKQVIDLCNHLIGRNYNFTWCCQTRFDLLDREMLGLMKRAGCRLIHFGVEAGSDRMLKPPDKGITVAAIEKGMREVHAAGIESACFFIMGFPESGRDGMRDTVRFAKRLNPTYALFHVAAPDPGTRLYEQVRNDPNVRFSDGTLFPEAIEGAFSLEQLKSMTRKAYLSFYTRPGYVWTRVRKGQFQALGTQARLFWNFVGA